ncbi:hypothetical protein [Histidinibacterium lentulum]|uniref:hypothetical protein n=1 Tax=Histidinibacterium lentulum TaxID=2480588 RepID=UPI001617F840|nr:hypothetical protein [Histidinibacterium lentulum]
MRTRRLTGLAALALIAGVLVLDSAVSEPLNPYRAPPVIAFGSGQVSTGAHCAALPAAE